MNKLVKIVLHLTNGKNISTVADVETAPEVQKYLSMVQKHGTQIRDTFLLPNTIVGCTVLSMDGAAEYDLL